MDERKRGQMTSDATDTIDTLIARYVAGNLPTPARVLVASHLELKPRSRALARGLEIMAGEELEHERPKAIGNSRSRLAAILDSEPPAPIRLPKPRRKSVFPRALRDYVGFDADETPWRTKMPGFREHDLGEIEGFHVSLFWIRPGRRIPSHTHGGVELSLVLDGAFTDVHGRYGRGDISIADETVEHRPTAEMDRPCIGMAITDAPLRLTGSIPRRLMDIIGG
jgi:putative transcriptional regulator